MEALLKTIPEIPESKLESSVQTKLNSSSGNSTIKSVTNQTELIAALTGTEKELSIQSDFTLSSNVTIPSGAILSDGGGKITVSTFEITFLNNSFKSDYLRAFIDLGQSGSINNASTFSNGDINLVWFGLVNDGIVGTSSVVQSGTDNRNIFREAQKIYNKTGGKAVITSGNYAFSVVTSRGTVGDEPNNLYLEGKASMEMIGDVKLLVLPNALQGYDAFSVYKWRDGYLEGGIIIGDKRDHIWGGPGNGDSAACHGLIIDYDSKYADIKTPVTNCPGDNFYCVIGSSVLYSAANGTQIQETDFYVVNGGNPLATIEDNGTITASTSWAYTKLYDITTASSIEQPIMIVGSHAFAGETGFVSNTIMIAWYDASDVFIERTGLVDIYSKIPTKTNHIKFRLIARIPPLWSDFLASVVIDYSPEFITLSPNYSEEGVRQGISNIPARSILENVHFKNNGQRYDTFISGTPAYHIDIEDGYQRRRDIEIRGCHFTNGKLGVLIIKGAKSVKIHNNTFDYETDVNYTGDVISTQNGHENMFFNNVVKGKSLTIGRQDYVHDNEFFDSRILTSNEGELVKNNVLYNSRLGQTAIGTGKGVYNSTTYENNRIILNRPLENNEVTITFEDNYIAYKDLIIEGKNQVYNLGNKKLTSCSSSTDIYSETLNNIKITGIVAENPETDYIPFPVAPINNLNTSESVMIQTFGADNITLSNSKIGGFLWLRLTNYPQTGIGTYTTYTIDNVDINITNATKLNTFYALNVGRSANRPDVNLVIKNCEINIISGNKFIDFWHYGTTIFENVKFITGTTGQTVDLTTRVNGDIVTFLNCDFGDTTFILRPQDSTINTNIIKSGILNYNDLGTTTTPISVTGGSGFTYLTNDEAGAQTNKVYPPYGVTDVWNEVSNEFDFSQLSLGSKVEIRLDLTVTTSSPNTQLDCALELAIGGTTYDIQWDDRLEKSSGVHEIVVSNFIYIGDTNTKDNPAKFKIESDSNIDVQVNGWACYIHLY